MSNNTSTIDGYFKNRDNRVYSNSKDENIKVWKHTQHIFTRGSLKKIIPSPSQGYSQKWTIEGYEDKDPPFESTTVRVFNCDTLDRAKEMIDEGLKPMVLNMASNFKPGGGVRSGARAQEECLFRRSNYFLTLDVSKLPDNMYPLEGSECIYSPGVTVVKDVDNKLLPKEQHFTVDFLAIAGLRRPKLNGQKTEFRFDDDREELYRRVDRIYQVALDQGHESMLLGALGCGAFKNPVEEVVEVFKDTNKYYDGWFKVIDFAVLSDDTNPNYAVFKKELEKN